MQTCGVETETAVPFAGLVDLLTPLADCLPALPARQAEALQSALAIGPPRPADRLAVLVGAFNLLCAGAAERPVLSLVDDAHWLDAASSEAIAFAARRIGADRVALLIATRSTGHPGIPVGAPAAAHSPASRATSSRAAGSNRSVSTPRCATPQETRLHWLNWPPSRMAGSSRAARRSRRRYAGIVQTLPEALPRCIARTCDGPV